MAKTNLTPSSKGVTPVTTSYSLSDLEAGNDELRIDLTGAVFADIFIRDISSTSAARPVWQLSADGGATVISGASDYKIYFNADNGSPSHDEASSCFVGDADRTTSFSGVISLSNINAAARTRYYTESEGANNPRWRSGWLDTADVVNTLVLTLNQATTFDALDIEVTTYR